MNRILICEDKRSCTEFRLVCFNVNEYVNYVKICFKENIIIKEELNYANIDLLTEALENDKRIKQNATSCSK